MSQKLQDKGAYAALAKKFENVVENWVLYDTVLITPDALTLSFPVGYFVSYAAAGAANQIPFFNVRNRNSGLAYNNQDTRDQLPYAMKIYTIGVQFFVPSTAEYRNNAGVPDGQQVSTQTTFAADIPRHCSLELQTNQDIRLKLNSLMAPPGVGAIGGGVAQGQTLTNSFTSPNMVKSNWNQGESILTNRWGFRNPIEVPRRANLSATIRVSEYGRQLLQTMPGPLNQPLKAFANDESYYFIKSCAGIRVMIGGQRLVQQRGQAHV